MRTTKVLILLYLLFLLSAKVFSQGADGVLPNFHPVTPEAGKLGRYGNSIPISSTGNMHFSVPIHTFQVGQSTWPVQLNYRYGGLILEEKPSLFGLGWTLQGQGAVTREVRGLPDYSNEGYYGPLNLHDMVNDHIESLNDSDRLTLRETKNFSEGRWDGEVDVYHVSAGNMAFSFKLDENDNPVYLSQHNFKVRSFSDSVIDIVDDEGTIYVFSELVRNIPSDATPQTTFEYTTSWLISSITYNNTQTINFFYDSDTYQSYDFFANGGITFYPDGFLNPHGQAIYYGQGYYNDGTNQTTINRRVIRRISCPKGEILFNYTTRGNGSNIRKVCTNIKARSTIDFGTDNYVKDYDLDYAGSRDVLKEVSNKSQSLYKFEYFFEDQLPSFLHSTSDKALAQDEWRFFNAKANEAALSIPNSQFTADNSPDLTATKRGALTKITYPTQGFSKISYKQNQILQDYTPSSIPNSNLPFNRQILLTQQSDGNLTGAPGTKVTTYTHTFDNPVIASVSHLYRGTLTTTNLKLNITLHGDCPDSVDQPTISPVTDDYHINARAARDQLNQVPQICLTLGEEYGPDNDDPGYYSYNQDSGGHIIIKPGTYTFEIINTLNTNGDDAYGEIKVLFHDPGEPQAILTNVGGIRVASVAHHTSVYDTIPVMQYYDYSKGVLLNRTEPIQISLRTRTDQGDVRKTEFLYSAKRFNSLDVDLHAPVFYGEIIEHEGRSNLGVSIGQTACPECNDYLTVLGNEDNSEENHGTYFKGYRKTTYKFPVQNYRQVYPIFPQSKDLSRGRIDSLNIVARNEDYIRSTKQDYKKFIKRIDEDGNDDDSNHPWSLRIGLKSNYIADCRSSNSQQLCTENPIEGSEAENHQLNFYQYTPYKETHSSYKASSAIQTEHLDTNAGLEQVISETSTVYNSKFAVDHTINTSSDERTTKTTFFYPYNTNEAGNSDLLSINKIAMPTKTRVEMLDDVDTVLSHETSYTTHRTSGSIVVPDETYTIKGNEQPEVRVKFHRYDDFGNPLELSKPNGTRVSYIWGYNKQYPIAKIENGDLNNDGTAPLVSAAISRSNEDDDRTIGTQGNEGELREALQILRQAMPKAMVITYTYDPLIGVTSMTDPRGYTIYYDYDYLNRLEKVFDAEGNILSENEYNYRAN